jgi:hypothetical protein
MFKHPIRDLAVLSLVGWFVKRSVNKRGGWTQLMGSASRPFTRRRLARR